MRILILTSLYPNRWQPHRAQFNRQQFAALANKHEVRLIAPVAWTAQLHRPRQDRPGGCSVRDGLVIEHPCFVYPPKVLRSWHGSCFLRSIRPAFERAVGAFRPQIVLASWAYPDAWATVKLARAANLPVVVKVHGSDIMLLPGGARRRQTIEALTSADAVIAVSRKLAERVVELGVDPSRVHVVYNGVDTTLFYSRPAGAKPPELGLSADPLVLFIGNLAPVKGLDTLLDACVLLRDRGVRFQCRLIGQGELRQALSRQIQAANLNQWVQLHGPCHLEKLPDWYRAAGVLVLPSLSEGVPNVILEAQACGTPVVASRVGGIPEILDDASLVPPKDARSLADAIERTLQRPNVVARPLTGWADSADQLGNILSEVAARKGKAAA